jgi:molybdopterin molybdotransferase
MLSPKEAEALIISLVQPLADTEVVTLESACDRILAAPVSSGLDFPYWDNSAMDGYAVKFSDVEGCSAEQPAVLEIIEEIRAGVKPQRSLQVGQAARIFTGAMLPEGADTIVMQENTQREGNQVRVFSCPDAPQAFVRKCGEFYQAGNPLLLPGIRLSAPEIAVLATAQCTQLKVYRRPRVAIFSTGDELVMPDCPLQPGQIVDSNQYALAAFVAQNGGIPLCLGIVRDRRDLLAQKISEAITAADIVLSTGGVSVGEYDYVEQLLEHLGGTLHIRSVAVKPGKPLTVATFANGCLYFGIPGNPVSALVCCWRFVQPALKKLSGLAGAWQPRFLKARSRDRLHADGKRETYLWGRLQAIAGRYEFQLASGSPSSGNLINLAGTNALAVLPVGTTTVLSGDEVEVMLRA